ncbi:DNA-binding protein [Hydrogenophaga sp. BPS33]|uniref:DNA-binding protein n=1 Tax=Hydrogenophaga sp. BPS33 TaxID=2651974 RepID=UPI00131F4A20|nr:DNA-binding protein [Hydrogenophaga sp. BPS33]QHE89219.1 hypothetical protein F9K07_29990 [Hydrogenophaga sp. BPS33]
MKLIDQRRQRVRDSPGSRTRRTMPSINHSYRGLLKHWSRAMLSKNSSVSEDVWVAADAVLLVGEKPAIERVRQHAGTGSPNTAGPLLEQWFKHLARRIQDPGAFAAPVGVLDPVLQAAQHFWETALAQTREDFDERLKQGLADAVASMESEQARAQIADAATLEATAEATRLKAELTEQGALLRQVHEELAAERARLVEIPAALAVEKDRLLEERQRADAADRRVALELELERERTARTKAERQVERQVEALQKAADAAREAEAIVQREARQKLEAARQREESLQTRLTLAQAELVTRERLEALRAMDDAKSAEKMRK